MLSSAFSTLPGVCDKFVGNDCFALRLLTRRMLFLLSVKVRCW